MSLATSRQDDDVLAAPTDLDLDAAIVDIVSRGAVKVPPYPAVALKVEALVRREDFGLDELSKLVASDQALAADALRCANSAFYSRGSSVASLTAAITCIGAKEVVRLALASGLGAHAHKAGPLASLKRRIWMEALVSAGLAQALARSRRLPAEEAFVCGLLHDFGKMIAVSCVEDLLVGQEANHARPLEEWIEVVDRYHVELGLVLAAQWALPALVSDVITLHHGDDLSGTDQPRMVALIQATDEVVHLLNDRTSVGPEELGAVSALSGAECEIVTRVLERLPAFIASFETGQGADAGPSAVEQEPADHFMAGPTPVSFPVTLSMGREVRTCQAMGIATSNLMVTGAAPLPENVLMEMKLGSTPPLTCWATVKLSWPEGAGHTILLQPFALNGASQEIWKDLVRSTTAAPTAAAASSGG
jgi:putative nucleotidyltransferase with HDIG domain